MPLFGFHINNQFSFLQKNYDQCVKVHDCLPYLNKQPGTRKHTIVGSGINVVPWQRTANEEEHLKGLQYTHVWQNGYNISKQETSNTKHTYRM